MPFHKVINLDSVDLSVLKTALQWQQAGRQVTLVTVLETWGSATRHPGAMLAIDAAGRVMGSVSGGGVEDDLIERVRSREQWLDTPALLTYGVTKEEAARFGLPCAGTLRLLQEPLHDPTWVIELLKRCDAHSCNAV